jgi:hypothetical protein
LPSPSLLAAKWYTGCSPSASFDHLRVKPVEPKALEGVLAVLKSARGSEAQRGTE